MMTSGRGGFDELFPNDAPTDVGEVAYPDHCELWSAPWQVDASSPDSVTLSVTGGTTGVRVAKTFSVSGPDLKVRYELEHGGDSILRHLFKLHAAFAISEGCRIDLTGGRVEKVDREFGSLLRSNDRQLWPTSVELSRCRRLSSRTHEFFYVSDLPERWCGITDIEARSWVRINYPKDVFPYCWIFMTYGGWRDHNVVVLGPSTNYPKDLRQAISRGTQAELVPGSKAVFEVTVSVGQIL